jgi:hypothetical protein
VGLDWDSGQLWMRSGKGQKDRTSWRGDDLVVLLKRYVEEKPGEPASLTFQVGAVNLFHPATCGTGRKALYAGNSTGGISREESELNNYIKRLCGELVVPTGIEPVSPP